MKKLIVIIVAVILIAVGFVYLAYADSNEFPWGDDNIVGTAEVHLVAVDENGKRYDMAELSNPINSILYGGVAVNRFEVWLCVKATDATGGQYPNVRLLSNTNSPLVIKFRLDDDSSSTYHQESADYLFDKTIATNAATPVCTNSEATATYLIADVVDAEPGFIGACTLTVSMSGTLRYYPITVGEVEGAEEYNTIDLAPKAYSLFVGDAINIEWSWGGGPQ